MAATEYGVNAGVFGDLAGHLQAAYMAVASLSHFRALVERQNRLHAGDL